MTTPAQSAAAIAVHQTPVEQKALDVGLMRLCGRNLAVPAENIREVVPLPARLHPDFSGGGACAGTIVIRGRVIPVLDITTRLGFPPRTEDTGVVLILRREQALVGLIMDMVSGLARIGCEHVQPFHSAAREFAPIVGSSFPHEDALVGLVDPAAVFDSPGAVHAEESAPISESSATVDNLAVVLVSSAGTNLALEAGMVVATVPSVQLQPSCAMGSKWIGVVPYLGQEVPVVDDLSLLGLSGRAAEAPSGAIVILQFNEQHLLGLKIDHVRRILSLRKNAIRSLPEALGERLSLFEGAVVDHEGLQNLLLDRRALVDCEPLRMVAALCRKADTAEHGREIGRHGAGSAGELEPFVVFRTGGRRRAAPLASVRQIIPYPTKHTGARRSGSAMKGIATYNGAPLPLLDAAGADATAGAYNRMVMVVEKKGSYSGLVVEKLETIARTAMQRRPGPSEQGQFIQASVAGQPIAVPVCNLFEEVDRLAELEPLSR